MMNRQNKLITMYEYGEYPIHKLKEKINEKGIRQISNLNKKNKTQIFKLFHDKLKSTQYVGFIKIQKCTIQVLPKIYSEEKNNIHFLLQMLRYTNKLKIKEQDLGELDKIKEDIFEVVVYLYAKHLRELLRRDFKKNYVTNEEEITFLKGKLLINQQIRNNYIDNTKYYCRYDEFTENNLMNQIFKYSTELFFRATSSKYNKKLLEDILIYLCDVDYKKIDLSDFEKIKFTRLNQNYKPILNLCKLIFENMNIQFSAANKLETFVFMFDMNRLFEEFIYEFIKRNRRKITVNNNEIKYIKDQKNLGKLFNEFNMRIDIFMEISDGTKILLDTKYKLLDEEMVHHGLSQLDMYQMFAYSTSQNEKYKNIVLLYPDCDRFSNNLNKKILSHNIDEDTKINIFVRFIDLTKIFDETKMKLDEKQIIEELNQVLSVDLS
jgi:5-methylcytosine-specific restriction enzyme subunit McrC